MKRSFSYRWLAAAAALAAAWPAACWAAEDQREPVKLTVVAVNPSPDKAQQVPVRVDLPQEVTRADILDAGELKVEFDDERSVHYAYKSGVQLKPKETRIFEVLVRDVWFVPSAKINELREYTKLLQGRLEPSEYRESADKLADAVFARIDSIEVTQNDETLTRKARIGVYRNNLEALAKIKEDLARMEKLLTFTGGPPVPEILQKSPLKSDAPSNKTTWLIVLMIVVFMGLLGGLFFFTWQRRVKDMQDFSAIGRATFSSSEGNNPSGKSPPDHAKGKAA